MIACEHYANWNKKISNWNNTPMYVYDQKFLFVDIIVVLYR